MRREHKVTKHIISAPKKEKKGFYLDFTGRRQEGKRRYLDYTKRFKDSENLRNLVRHVKEDM